MTNIKSVIVKVENYETGKTEDVVLRNKELLQGGHISVKVKIGNKNYTAYDNPVPVIEEEVMELETVDKVENVQDYIDSLNDNSFNKKKSDEDV